MVATEVYGVFLSMDGAPLMIRFDNDHHGTLDAEVGAVHPITVILNQVRSDPITSCPADAQPRHTSQRRE
ncbi:MAG TPA: hypothetical protein VE914_06505, partial [Candidatus Angelobacter sp.]|nr:hypothetical protein [Candidatus Angelobacter sp.]